ncbi:MAG: patatin-like phospholipase family protein [Casimicrobiaceae bacterium]|nr:patatin-like phospholipase family protein [Casimicrobiaceae bacterium]MCX8099410.1 patatin-like phospholipase family protein [Casimicrobiaceae bacterium]MDW8311799.1 patatin-like phospholipase family protein [Burkholderiales bacterium]
MVQRRAMLRGAVALAASTALPGLNAQSASTARRARIALVLGSGGARGFAHVGVYKAFERAGIRPDLVVGSSAGAFVGAFIAAGKSAAEMEELALKTREIELVDMQEGQRRGLILGEALERFVAQSLEHRLIEQLPIPFVAVATDFRTGEAVAFRRGPVARAVRASCSIPSVFVPLKIDGVEYVDGGLVSPLPVKVARREPVDIVLAVDVAATPTHLPPNGVYEQVMHSIDLMSRALIKIEAREADIVIRPEIGHFASTDFSARSAFIQAGFAIGQRFVPVIQERLAKWGAPVAQPRRRT